jgi:CO/xanthine dehydrogenase FAD-binding subunit
MTAPTPAPAESDTAARDSGPAAGSSVATSDGGAAAVTTDVAFHRPADLAEAVRLLAEHPDAVPVAGGTDLMVAVNYRLARPPSMLDLTGLAELREWADEGDSIRIGSGVPYARIVAELATVLPGLAAASRTVGSPQIRNRGTLGGNLATASPAGDGHPPLLATGATIEIASAAAGGPADIAGVASVATRTVSIAEFFTGPKRSVLRPGELITAVTVPKAAGPQQFLKVGTRNAMVIAVCSLAVALDLETRRVGTGIGSAGPTPLTAPDANRIELPWTRPALFNDALAEEFGRRVAAAARPIDDVRGTADYRRHALAVCAARALRRVWTAAHSERTT